MALVAVVATVMKRAGGRSRREEGEEWDQGFPDMTQNSAWRGEGRNGKMGERQRRAQEKVPGPC